MVGIPQAREASDKVRGDQLRAAGEILGDAQLNKLVEMMLDELYTTNVAGANLDSMGGLWGIARYPNESDAALTVRLKQTLNSRRPDPYQTRLFILLVKLGLKEPNKYLPLGWSVDWKDLLA